MEALPLECAQYIKEIGRGRDNARPLSRADAALLWGALLDGRVPELETGAMLIVWRIKGESVDELDGFLEATESRGLRLPVPASPDGMPSMPVVIPSYNGARNLPNLTPLLAGLLAREGVPVLVHGKVATPASTADRLSLLSAHGFDAPGYPSAPPPRVTSAEIFETMGLPICRTCDDAAAQLARGAPVFMPITELNAPLARVLALRRRMGVRSPAHSLVKLLQPFAGPAVRLASFTHPEYRESLARLFVTERRPGAVLLMRATEGEAVANARRLAPIERFVDGVGSVVVAGDAGVLRALPILADSRDAATTAVWTQAVLAGERPVPDAIAAQVVAILETRDLLAGGHASRQAVA